MEKSTTKLKKEGNQNMKFLNHFAGKTLISLTKLPSFLQSLMDRPDLDYETFKHLEEKRSPQEIRRGRLS